MCNVELPCRGKCPPKWGYALFDKYKFYAAMYPWAGTTWFRLTASAGANLNLGGWGACRIAFTGPRNKRRAFVSSFEMGCVYCTV